VPVPRHLADFFNGRSDAPKRREPAGETEPGFFRGNPGRRDDGAGRGGRSSAPRAAQRGCDHTGQTEAAPVRGSPAVENVLTL